MKERDMQRKYPCTDAKTQEFRTTSMSKLPRCHIADPNLRKILLDEGY